MEKDRQELGNPAYIDKIHRTQLNKSWSNSVLFIDINLGYILNIYSSVQTCLFHYIVKSCKMACICQRTLSDVGNEKKIIGLGLVGH